MISKSSIIVLKINEIQKRAGTDIRPGRDNIKIRINRRDRKGSAENAKRFAADTPFATSASFFSASFALRLFKPLRVLLVAFNGDFPKLRDMTEETRLRIVISLALLIGYFIVAGLRPGTAWK